MADEEVLEATVTEEVTEAPAPAEVEEFKFVTLPPQVSFLSQGVPPPGWLYITPDDTLLIRAWTALTGVELAFDARVLFPDGRIGSYWQRYQLAGGVVENSYEIRLAEGFLLSAWIRPTTTVPVGACWVQCILQRGAGAAASQVQLIAAGYATRRAGLAWPYPRYQNPVEGAGRLRQVDGTTPAAGANCYEVVSAGVRWRFLTFRVNLTTGAAVADRRVALAFYRGAWQIFYGVPQHVQPASTGWTYSWGVAVPPRYDVMVSMTQDALPGDLVLAAGDSIYVVCWCMQAADQFTWVRYLVEEWVEP